MARLIEEQQWKKVNSVSGKVLNYHISRGQYDFAMVSQADIFESVASCALKANIAGTLSKVITLESIDLTLVREIGNKLDFSAPKL